MTPSGVNQLSHPCIYERKSRFMKWLSKLFRTGNNRGGTAGNRNPQLIGDENMFRVPFRSVDERSRTQKEKEELDHAIALSLAEDSRRPSGYRWQEKDKELARSLQDSLNPPIYPPYAPPVPQYYPYGTRTCGGCKQDILYGNYLECMGTFFHPQCFCCRSCGHPIVENEFSLSGRDPYHKSCFKELAPPKCEVCHQFIPTNRAGLIEFRCHPFWSQKYCPSHEHDNTARCCSCERLESWDARYISVGDGRSLCFECMESAIMDTGDCQPLYHAIRDYYEGMNMRLDQQIPMLLVERQALNEAIVGEKNGLHHMPETRGLCLSEEQTVTSILKRPRIGGHQLIGMRTQHQKLTRRCEVTAILVLYSLPRLLTGAILAHELMHGWLRLKGYRNLNPEVEEGICQVLSYMWLETEVMPGFKNMPSTSTSAASSSTPSFSSKKGGKSNVEQKLGEFFMHQIANDSSPAYGGGFRAANTAVNKYGLRRTLDHIRLTGSFPL
ncbi:protein DA1-related 2 isoform X2 [Argentina anserina]|uniref:protein DA1-related 2 isoform X2 n=1 Tax=Argentina anserina TaxID=57926 RepID=UPI0021767331|nr:protein DA1-related 2 isoform X2 [Potentilla anserina]